MKYLSTLFLSLFFVSLVSGQTYTALTEQAHTCITNDSLEQAETLLLQALKLEPHNSRNALLFSNLGLVQRRLGRYDEAIESYTLALNTAPLAIPMLLDRGAIYLEKGLTDRAYVDYCQVLDKDKENTEALLMRAYIYTTRRDYKAAQIDFDQLLKLDPQSYNGRLGLALLEQKMGKLREALDRINTLLAEKQEDATLYVARAGIEQELKHIDLMMIDLEEAIRLDPTLVDAYLMRGHCYLEQKRKGLARQDFEKAISLGVPPAELREQLKACK